MDEEVDESRDVSVVTVLLVPALVVAAVNLAFYNQIRNQLVEPEPDAPNQKKKKIRFTVFFAVNIFVYLIVTQLFWGSLFVPIMICLVVAAGCGYFLANRLFPEREIQPVSSSSLKETKVPELPLEEERDFPSFLSLLGLDNTSKLTLQDQRMINENSQVTDGHDIIHKFLNIISLGQQTSLQDLSDHFQSLKDDKGISDGKEGIRDILFAVLTCCDLHLIQEVLRSLICTGHAVPIILPRLQDNPTLLHWGISRAYLSTTGEDVTSVINKQFVTISAIRFGKVGVSKSQFLNEMLSAISNYDGNFKVFLSEDKANAWSKGAVECAWYLPRQGNGDLNIPLAILNLRGDSQTYTRQADFCCKVSSTVIVFVEPPILDDIEQRINKLKETTHVILVSSQSDTRFPFQTTQNLTVIETNTSLKPQLGHIVLKHITETVSADAPISFTTFPQVCQLLNIDVDEELPNLKDTKVASHNISDDVVEKHGISRDELFPLQNLWKDWVAVDKEDIGVDGIEHKISSKLQRKREIRNLQKSSNVGEPIKIFLNSLNGDIDYGHLLYNRLEILSAHKLVMAHDNEEGADDDFDINDLVHEVEQMVECDHPSLRNNESTASEEQTYPETFAHLFERGVPLQMCDSSINAIPIKWLEEVFDSLQRRANGNDKVCVVSIIGCKETTKTSLINQLFGVNFSFSPIGNGLLAQLVPVELTTKENLGFDFLLVINTESITVSKDLPQEVLERNNFICSLATCLSDVVIINMAEKMLEQDTKIFLTTILSSLLRMKDVNKSGKCYLVKNSDKDPTKCSVEHYSNQVFVELENHFNEILKSEGKEKEHEDIIEAFSFDNRKCASTIRKTEVFLSREYQHNPSDILTLRQIILQILGKCALARAPMSFDGFCQRLADVGKALKTSSFVDNFYDTNVEKLNDEFVTLYRGMILKVRQELSESLSVACNDLMYSSLNDIESLKSSKLSDLSQTAGNKMEALRKNVSEMLHSTRYKCFLEQEHYFEQDIESNKVDFLQTVEKSFQDIIDETKESQPIANKVQNERERFIERLEKNIEHNPNDMLEETIEQSTQQFLTAVQNMHPMHELSVFQNNTEDNMNHLLNQCGKEVESLMVNKSLSDCYNNRITLSEPDDVIVMRDNFNVANEDKKIIFDNVCSTLKTLSCKPEHIVANSKEVCILLNDVEKEFKPNVDSITLYLFFCSKFLDEVHKVHLKKEVDALSVDDVDSVEGQINENATMCNQIDYEIKQAEPLDYPTLESKAVLLLSSLENVCSSSDMIILREVITSSNITKCSMLPSDLITLQRLDRYFIHMLPNLSLEDMNSINDTMNEVKMIMIGRSLAKACIDFAQTFNDVYKLIQRAIVDGGDSDKAKAAAIVHISAWSSDLIAVKRLEDSKMQNIANTFTNEQLKLCLAILKTKHNKNCDELIAGVLSQEIEKSVTKAAYESIVRRLRDSFSVNNVFNLKRNFIGTVLRDLCVKNGYLGFANFFKDYDTFTQKWIMEFMAKECNKENNSSIESLKNEIILFYVTNIDKVLDETTNQFKSQTEEKVKIWLELFEKNMRTYCKTNCRVNIIEDLANLTRVENFENFVEHIRLALKELKPQLDKSIILPHRGNDDDTKTWLMSLPGEIHIDLAQIIKGCTEQCPFCGAACEETLQGHEFHETELHYPGGLKSWHDVDTMKLFIHVCTSAVASGMRYRAPNFEFRPYSDYKEDYPTWNIPGQVDEPNVFWKYIFYRFNSQFATHYKCVEADIPPDWSNFTKEEAIRSVEIAYDLIPLNSVAIID